MRDFVTFALMSVKHFVVHRPKIRDCVKAKKEGKEPRTLDGKDKATTERKEVQRNNLAEYRKTLPCWWESCVAYTVREKTTKGSTSSESTVRRGRPSGGVGAEGKSKISINGVKNTENVESSAGAIGTAAKRKTEAAAVGLRSKPSTRHGSQSVKNAVPLKVCTACEFGKSE